MLSPVRPSVYQSDGGIIEMNEWVSSVLRPHQHSIGYTGDDFYRSKDPTNSIKVLKEDLQKTKKTRKLCYRKDDRAMRAI